MYFLLLACVSTKWHTPCRSISTSLRHDPVPQQLKPCLTAIWSSGSYTDFFFFHQTNLLNFKGLALHISLAEELIRLHISNNAQVPLKIWYLPLSPWTPYFTAHKPLPRYLCQIWSIYTEKICIHTRKNLYTYQKGVCGNKKDFKDTHANTNFVPVFLQFHSCRFVQDKTIKHFIKTIPHLPGILAHQ